MALTQSLAKDTTIAGNFVLATTDTYMTTNGINSPNQGNILSLGAVSYFDWITGNGVSGGDLGNGTPQSSPTLGTFVLNTSQGGTTPGSPFNYYANSVLNNSNALMQQPIRWNTNIGIDEVVWGVYFPQTDLQPAAGIGKIQGYSTTVNAPTSVSTNDANDATAVAGLTDLLARFGNKYLAFNGPVFTGNATNDLYGPQGAIAMGAFISYSNKNGTWLVYAG